MRIRHRLIVMAALPAVLTSLIFIYVWIQIPRVVHNATQLFEQHMSPIGLLTGISRTYADAVVDVAHQTRAQMLLWNDAQARLENAKNHIQSAWQEYLNQAHSDQEQTLLTQHADAPQQALNVISELQQFVQQRESYSMGSYIDMSLYPHLTPMLSLIDELIKVQNNLAKQGEQKALTATTTTIRTIAVIAFILISAMIIFGWLGYRKILQPIHSIRDAVIAIEAQRNLNMRLPSNDRDEFGELSSAFNKMMASISATFAHMQNNSSALNQSAQQLYQLAANTGQLATQQLHNMLETSQQMQQVAQAAADVSSASAQMESSTVAVVDLVAHGHNTVTDVINAIQQTTERTQQSAYAAEHLLQLSANIGSVLDVISSIAEQTNLLALNAAIEAARAGEHGRGFAVVADEVRSLAQRTSSSTKEIADLVNSIQQGANSTSDSSKEIHALTAYMVNQAQVAGTALQDIKHAAEALSCTGKQVSVLANEQLSISQAIQLRTHDMSQQANTTQGQAQETEVVSQQLEQLAREQQLALNQFQQ